MKKSLIILAIIIISGAIMKSGKADTVVIPNESLRFRVIANSNDLNDYKIKMQVKEAVESELINLLAPAATVKESKAILSDNLDHLDEIVAQILLPLNISYKIDLGANAFPAKIFKGVIYEAGSYDSLVITIGSGNGNNWWCVLFPPLCLLEENENVSDIEYQLYISRIIDYFK